MDLAILDNISTIYLYIPLYRRQRLTLSVLILGSNISCSIAEGPGVKFLKKIYDKNIHFLNNAKKTGKQWHNMSSIESVEGYRVNRKKNNGRL